MEAPSSDPNVPSCGDAYRAAVNGEMETLKKFYKKEPTSSINIWGDTIFHVLVQNGHTKALKELLNLSMPVNGLKEKNCNGNTALHEAARVGALEIAILMVRKEKSLVYDSNNIGETPLFCAAAFGQTKMFQFLATKNTSDEEDDAVLRRNDGCTILHAAITGEFYGLALEITERYPGDLAFARDKDGITSLHQLVKSPSSFRSGTYYSEIKIANSSFIPLELFKLIIYFCFPSNVHKSTRMEDMEDPWEFQERRKPGMIRRLFRWFPYLGTIDDEKQMHKLALELAKLLIKKEPMCMKGGYYTRNITEEGPSINNNTIISETLMVATKHGIVEVVDVILKELPWAIEFVDENEKNILHLVAEFCQAGVLGLLKSKGFLTAKMIAKVDKKGNTALHLAAKFDDHRHNDIHISAYMMAVEALWFKKIKDVCSQGHLSQIRNCEGKTANELFHDTHKELITESVKWIMNAANTAMLVSALVASMNFTAAFAVPGGYNQNTGLPIFAKTTSALPIFYAYTTAALFFCVCSLVACLSLFFSRFNIDDFYFIFPLKYLIACSSLFFSAIYTVTTFVQALILVTNGEFTTLQWSLALSATIIAIISFICVYVDVMFPVFCYFVYLLFD